MIPGTYNFPVFPGADIDFSMDVTGLNLTGYTARASMRPSWQSSYVLPLAVTLTQVLTVWRIAIFVSGSLTTSMERVRGSQPSDSSPYFWDLEIIAPDGKISRLVQGSNSVGPEATR